MDHIDWKARAEAAEAQLLAVLPRITDSKMEAAAMKVCREEYGQHAMTLDCITAMWHAMYDAASKRERCAYHDDHDDRAACSCYDAAPVPSAACSAAEAIADRVNEIVAAPPAPQGPDDAALCKSLRMAKASLTREGVTVPVWEGSLYLEAADRIEALVAQRGTLICAGTTLNPQWTLLGQRIVELERELAACRADAERLSWLDRDDIELNFDASIITGEPFVVIRNHRGDIIGKAGNIRAAIDVARAAPADKGAT